MIAVPIPDRVAALIGSQMPLRILQAEIDVESAALEFGRFHTPAGAAQFDSEDRVDREHAMSEIRVANKILAAYNPKLVIHAGGAR